MHDSFENFNESSGWSEPGFEQAQPGLEPRPISQSVHYGVSTPPSWPQPQMGKIDFDRAQTTTSSGELFAKLFPKKKSLVVGDVFHLTDVDFPGPYKVHAVVDTFVGSFLVLDGPDPAYVVALLEDDGGLVFDFGDFAWEQFLLTWSPEL